MLNIDQARAFAEHWCAAWNRHDLDEIMSHYADPPDHCSPLIAERLGRADGTIRSLADLRDYFRRGLELAPTLRFELRDVFLGVASLAIVYENHQGKSVIELVELDERGQVARSAAYYR